MLLRKLEPSSRRRMSLTFLFGNELVEFGPDQFCAVTSFQFKGDVMTPNNSTFHRDVFNCKLFITFLELDMRFREACDEDGGKSEVSYKLALAFVVFGIFFIKEKTAKCIEMKYMHLLDDIEAFVTYPWGVVAYEFLVSKTHRAKKKLIEKTGGAARVSVDAHGFITAVQCWVYEIFPDIGRNVAEKVCEVHFEISEEEKPKMEILGVAEYIETLVPPPSTVQPRSRKRKLSFDQRSNDSSMIPLCIRRTRRLPPESSLATSKEVAATVEDLCRRFGEFEAGNSITEVLAMFKVIESRLDKISSMIPSKVVINHDTPKAPRVESCIVEDTEGRKTHTVEESNVDKTPSGKLLGVPKDYVGDACGTEIISSCDEGVENPGIVNKRKVGRPKGSTVKKIVQAPTSSRRVTCSTSSGIILHTSQPTPRRYDSFESDYASRAVITEFQSWFVEIKKIKS